MKWNESHSVVSDSLQPHGLNSPWNFPGQNTVLGNLCLLQGIFPTQVFHTAGRFLTSWATREAQLEDNYNIVMVFAIYQHESATGTCFTFNMKFCAFKCPSLLFCVHAKLFQLCPTLCDPMDSNAPGSSVHGILQTRILEWVAIPSSRGSSQSKDRTHVSCLLHWQVDSLLLAPSIIIRWGGGYPVLISHKAEVPRLVNQLRQKRFRTQIFCLHIYSFQHTEILAKPFAAIKAHFLPVLRGIGNSCSVSPIIISLHMYESCDFVPFQRSLRQVK